MDKLHNLHHCRAAADIIQFVSVQVDLCKLLRQLFDFVWVVEGEVDDEWTLMVVGRKVVIVA